MWKFITDMCRVLDMVKGFNTCWSTGCNDKFIVDYDEKRYLISLKEIEKSDDCLAEADKYLYKG